MRKRWDREMAEGERGKRGRGVREEAGTRKRERQGRRESCEKEGGREGDRGEERAVRKKGGGREGKTDV